MSGANTGLKAESAELEGSEETPELSVRVVSMLLHYFRRTLGQPRLEELWRHESIRLPISHFEDHSNFVSLRFTERLTALLATASGDPDFIRKAAMNACTPESLGFL